MNRRSGRTLGKWDWTSSNIDFHNLIRKKSHQTISIRGIVNSENINFKRRTLWVAILFHHIVCLCTPPQLCLCCYIILPPLHLCCVHIPKSILFISSTIVHLIHFIYHSPIHSFLSFIAHHFHIYHIWSYSCYIVIKPYFHDRLRNMILLKYIPSWVDIKTYASKPDFIKITQTYCYLIIHYSSIILLYDTQKDKRKVRYKFKA